MDIRVKEQPVVYHLREFDDAKLAATKDAWIKTAEALEIPTLEFDKTLAWVDSHRDYKKVRSDSYAYGVFADGSDVCSAVLDLVYTTRAGPDVGWLKMLQVDLGPDFAAPILTKELAECILYIYIESVRGTIALTEVHRSRVVKLYARNDALSHLLLSLNEHIATHSGDLKMTSKFEGRFLVITAI